MGKKKLESEKSDNVTEKRKRLSDPTSDRDNNDANSENSYPKLLIPAKPTEVDTGSYLSILRDLSSMASMATIYNLLLKSPGDSESLWSICQSMNDFGGHILQPSCLAGILLNEAICPNTYQSVKDNEKEVLILKNGECKSVSTPYSFANHCREALIEIIEKFLTVRSKSRDSIIRKVQREYPDMKSDDVRKQVEVADKQLLDLKYSITAHISKYVLQEDFRFHFFKTSMVVDPIAIRNPSDESNQNRAIKEFIRKHLRKSEDGSDMISMKELFQKYKLYADKRRMSTPGKGPEMYSTCSIFSRYVTSECTRMFLRKSRCTDCKDTVYGKERIIRIVGCQYFSDTDEDSKDDSESDDLQSDDVEPDDAESDHAESDQEDSESDKDENMPENLSEEDDQTKSGSDSG